MNNDPMNTKNLTVTRRQLLKTTSALALLAALPRCATVAPRERVAFDAIPLSDYGFDTTADDVVANLDLSGLTILITGCNSGLGYDSMRAPARTCSVLRARWRKRKRPAPRWRARPRRWCAN